MGRPANVSSKLGLSQPEHSAVKLFRISTGSELGKTFTPVFCHPPPRRQSAVSHFGFPNWATATQPRHNFWAGTVFEAVVDQGTLSAERGVGIANALERAPVTAHAREPRLTPGPGRGRGQGGLRGEGKRGEGKRGRA